MEKPKTNWKHLPEQQNPSLDDRNSKMLLVEFPYGVASFPVTDVIHVFSPLQAVIVTLRRMYRGTSVKQAEQKLQFELMN